MKNYNINNKSNIYQNNEFGQSSTPNLRKPSYKGLNKDIVSLSTSNSKKSKVSFSGIFSNIFSFSKVKESDSSSKYSVRDVEKILKGYLRNESCSIVKYSELFNNLDKLDFENIDEHLKNLKIFLTTNTNHASDTVKNGYFYSKEGAQAFSILASRYSSEAPFGKVSPLSINLGNYDYKTILTAEKRGLLDNLDNTNRVKRLTSLSDKEFADFQKRVDDIWLNNGLDYQACVDELKNKLVSSVPSNGFSVLIDDFFNNCIHKDTVTAQLEMLDLLNELPIKLTIDTYYSALKNVNVDNIHIFKNVLSEISQRKDLTSHLLYKTFSISNENTNEALGEFVKISDVPLSKIIEICSENKDFVNGLVPKEVILEKINNDSFVKTIRAINSSQIDLSPNCNPTKLNPLNIKPSALALVHMTDYSPSNGKILSTRDKIGGSRNSVHFTLNHPVEEHRFGSWDDKKNAIIMPYQSTKEENPSGLFIEGMPNDIYTNGSVKIPKGSIIVKHNTNLEEGSAKIYDSSDIEGVKVIETSEFPHSVVPCVLEKMGFTNLNASAPLGQFNYLKNNGNDVDSCYDYFMAWKKFCNQEGLRPAVHTSSVNGIAENLVENVSKLCSNKNNWKHDSYNFKNIILKDIKILKKWQNKGYFVSFDLDKFYEIVSNSKTPLAAVSKMQNELGFHPTTKLTYFSLCSVDTPVEMYDKYLTSLEDDNLTRKVIEEESSYPY